MKKATLLLLTIGIFTSLSFTIFQGGNTPVPGIDIIIKREISNSDGFHPIAGAALGIKELKEISALAGIERSVYISKVITPIIEKATKEKGLEKDILKGLIKTRCIECKSFEAFTFKVPSKNSKKSYVITLNTKFDTKWITVITDRDNFEKPIPNPHHFNLINKVNELESKLKPEERKELVERFKKTNFSKLNTREQVFKEYIKYFKTPGVYVEEITKFPPVKKKKATLNKRTNIKDVNNKY